MTFKGVGGDVPNLQEEGASLASSVPSVIQAEVLACGTQENRMWSPLV